MTNEESVETPITNQESTQKDAMEDTPQEKTGWKQVASGKDHIDNYRKILEQNPWNPGLWNQLIKESLILNDPILVRENFEGFLEYYPTCVPNVNLG